MTMHAYKRFIAGLVGALLAAIVYVAVIVLLALARRPPATDGVGAFIIVLSAIPVIVAAVVGFLIGFLWMRRRQQRRLVT